MKAFNQKNEILESLEALDPSQAEQVLAYIKGLLQSPQDEASYRKLKRNALKEIRQALGKSPRISTSF